MDYKIVTDSSCNLSSEITDKYGVIVLPLSYTQNGTEKYGNGDIQEFYKNLRENKLAKTSCVNKSQCEKTFSEILSQGFDLLYVGFSSALSATYSNAVSVLEELKKQYPDRKILYCDTLAASLGEGLLVVHAADLKEKGMDIQSLHSFLEDTKLHLCHWFTVDNLMYLKKGGRINTAVAIVGSLLGIKPVMHMNNEGKLVPAIKPVRGRRTSLNILLSKFDELAVEVNQKVFISHGDCIEDANYVADKLREKGVKDIYIDYVEPVIGSHSGPGTLALFFIGSKR